MNGFNKLRPHLKPRLNWFAFSCVQKTEARGHREGQQQTQTLFIWRDICYVPEWSEMAPAVDTKKAAALNYKTWSLSLHSKRNAIRGVFTHIHGLVWANGLCSLVVRVLGYRSRDPGSITGAIRSSEKYWVWNWVHSASWVQLRS
jgi:hypothetical protein